MTNLCRACFDGVYPIELPEPEHLGKHLLELGPVVPAPRRPVHVAGRWRRRRRPRPPLSPH